MTSKILRADGVTELANIKSVEFHETVNAETDLRPGCVASSYINVECYGSQSNAPVGGEALTYYQVVGETETLIGIFYAEPGISSKKTYSFTAYDSAIKLDTDFSNWLSANASSFPVTVGTLVAMACSVAGVTLSGTFPMADVSVDAFYADNITCRNILSWAAEIAGKFVHCNTSGELVFDWYTDATGYRLYPHSGTSGGETLVAYKQDGLNYKNYNARRISAVAIQPSGVEGAAYIYPASVTAVYATDPNNNGNVILYNLTAVDSSSNVTLSGDFDAYDTSGVGDVDIDAHVLADNTLMVTANAILSAVDTSDLMDVAENIYNAMRTIPPYRPCEAELFPNENPFRAGQIIQVTDIQGVSFTTVLMEMAVTDSVAVLLSTGNERHQDYSRDIAAKLVQLGADLVRINKLKVDWAEIGTAIVETLEANGINADWINAGALTVRDANNNIIFQADQDQKTAQIGGFVASQYLLTAPPNGSIAGMQIGSASIWFGNDPVSIISGNENGITFTLNTEPNVSDFSTKRMVLRFYAPNGTFTDYGFLTISKANGTQWWFNGNTRVQNFEQSGANATVTIGNPSAWRTALGLDIIPFKISTTVLSGSYIRYPVGSATDDRITANHIAIINPYYSTGFMSNYFFTCQVANGYANIYVRNSSGAQVAAGTTMNLAGIFVKT